MEKFYPQLFVMMSSALEGISPHWIEKAEYGDRVLSDGNRRRGIEALEPFEQRCIDLNMKASAVTVGKLLALLVVKGATYQKQAELLNELKGRLVDEMHGEVFFYLTPSEAARYEKWVEGWEEVIARFPDAVRDIEEVHKCFALSRYTASVFHSLLTVERGVIHLGTFIGVSDPKRGWDATCKRLATIMSDGHNNAPAGLGEHFGFLERANQCLQAMKHAWRNKVNHSDGRLAVLGSDFTPDVAEEIIMASRAFMRRLATELP